MRARNVETTDNSLEYRCRFGLSLVDFKGRSSRAMGFVNFREDVSVLSGTDGSFKQGSISGSYHKLVALFGMPFKIDLEDKVDIEWVLRFDDGTLVTIYNWKDGKNYLGSEGKEIWEIDTWMVGGFTSDALSRVMEILGND